MMGKKKAVKKTKELSVAIAEASTVGGVDETQQQEALTPRKRGRPRKIIDQKSEISEEKQEENPEEAQEIDSKKAKTSSEQQQKEEIKEEEEEEEAKKEQGQSDDEKELLISKEEPFSRKSRARRKGKPRKSS